MEQSLSKAFNSACRSLARRAHSAQEIASKLGTKGFEHPVIVATLSKLEALGYLDDMRFAQHWASMKAKSALWSDRRIAASLAQKGIDGESITASLRVARDETSEDEAIGVIIVKKLRGGDVRALDYKERVKLMNSLLHRGFGLETIIKCVETHGAENGI